MVTGECAAQKIIKKFAVSVYEHVYIIILSYNKINEFFFAFRPGHAPLNEMLTNPHTCQAIFLASADIEFKFEIDDITLVAKSIC